MTDQVATPFEDQTVPTNTEDQKPAPAAAPTEVQKPTVQIPEGLDEWIGEGKKYSSVEDALRSIPHAQNHIDKMQDENAEVRETAAQLRERLEKVEDLVQTISKKPSGESETPLTPDQLDELIETRLTLKEQRDLATANVNNVKETLISNFGDAEKANEAYKQKAADLGLSFSALNALSAESPEAVYTMFGLTKKSDPAPTKIHTDVNSEAGVHTQVVDTKPKSVMGQSTHVDDINAWRAAAPTE